VLIILSLVKGDPIQLNGLELFSDAGGSPLQSMLGVS
jgi:hypothetical protein